METETEIQEWQRKCREMQKTLRQSAQHGKDLLEENTQLKSNLQADNVIILATIENLKQERYSLKIRLSAAEKSEEALREELEATRDQCSKEVVFHTEELTRDNAKLTKRVRELEKELEDGDHQRGEFQASLEQLTIDNQSLKMAAAAGVHDKSSVVLDAELWHQTEQDLADRKQREEMLMETIDTKDKQLQDVEQSVANLRNRIADLEEILMNKENKLEDYINAADGYREEIADLQIQLQAACMPEADPNRRGNSLFSEVEDHRQRLEKHFNSLRTKYDTLLNENDNNLSRISSLKLQIAGLVVASRGKVNASHVEHLEMKLAQMRNELRLSLNRKETCAKPALATTASQPNSDNQSGFLKVMLRQTESRCEELEKENKSLQFKCMSGDEHARQVRHELRKAEQKTADIWAENTSLKVKLDDMQRKYGENKENADVKMIKRINTAKSISPEPTTNQREQTGRKSSIHLPPVNKQVKPKRAAHVTEQSQGKVPVTVVRVTQETNECNQQ